MSTMFLDLDRQDGETVFHAFMRKEKKVAQDYWQAVLANPRARRPPLVTIAFIACCIAVFNTDENHGMPYTPGPSGPWYGALVAMVSHLNFAHITQNMIMLALLGYFLEFTEGFRHVATVLWGGGCLGAAFHGVFVPSMKVRGASGAIYGVMWSQLSLLLLNWNEMPLRWVRLVLCTLLLSMDIFFFVTDRKPGLSYMSHFFGACAGTCVALVLGRNVQLRRREVLLHWLGVGGYTSLCIIALVGQQYAAAGLAGALIPVLLLRAAHLSRRAFVLKRTASQQLPSLQRNQPSSRLALLRNGTHLILTALVMVPAKGLRNRSKLAPRPKAINRAPPVRLTPSNRLDQAQSLPRPTPTQAAAKERAKEMPRRKVHFSLRTDGIGDEQAVVV